MVLMLLAVTVTNGMLLDFLLILLPVMLMPVSVTKKMLLLLFLLLLLFPALGTFPAHAENRFIVEDFRKLDKEEQLTRLNRPSMSRLEMVPVDDLYLHFLQRNTLKDSRSQLESTFMDPSEERFYPDLFNAHLLAYLLNHDVSGCSKCAFVRGIKLCDQALRMAISKCPFRGRKVAIMNGGHRWGFVTRKLAYITAIVRTHTENGLTSKWSRYFNDSGNFIFLAS